MLLNKKREKLPCHAVPTIRIFPGDDEFMGCVPGYTRIVIVMRMQQTGRTELSPTIHKFGVEFTHSGLSAE
jgi:hypothetical protein